jgi:predicted ATP-grasp superfamily ATP-dependent carboligase
MSHQATTPGHDDSSVVIVGASARAMAWSAAAAGWAVHAADLFADRDLRDVARGCVPVGGSRGPYPDALAAAVRGFPAGPWCYTGALENHPDLLDTIAAERPLAGNAGRLLHAVRDPDRLAAACRESGLAFPDTHRDPRGVPVDGSYLVKPLASAGGRGIGRWHGGRAVVPPPSIWQRHVAGRGVSASFICRPVGARLLGIVEQEIGLPWCHAAPFAFCAAVLRGPPEAHRLVTPAVAAQLARAGDTLATRLGLVGAVGIDAVIDDDERVWMIEVNPRPTASMELHERATGESVAAAHLAACGWPARPRTAPIAPPHDRAWGKAVLHAPHDVEISARLVAVWDGLAAAWRDTDAGWPAIADVPTPGQTIRCGSAWMTVFATADTTAGVRLELRRRAAALAASVSPPSAAASASASGRSTA